MASTTMLEDNKTVDSIDWLLSRFEGSSPGVWSVDCTPIILITLAKNTYVPSLKTFARELRTQCNRWSTRDWKSPSTEISTHVYERSVTLDLGDLSDLDPCAPCKNSSSQGGRQASLDLLLSPIEETKILEPKIPQTHCWDQDENHITTHFLVQQDSNESSNSFSPGISVFCTHFSGDIIKRSGSLESPHSDLINLASPSPLSPRSFGSISTVSPRSSCSSYYSPRSSTSSIDSVRSTKYAKTPSPISVSRTGHYATGISSQKQTTVVERSPRIFDVDHIGYSSIVRDPADDDDDDVDDVINQSGSTPPDASYIITKIQRLSTHSTVSSPDTEVFVENISNALLKMQAAAGMTDDTDFSDEQISPFSPPDASGSLPSLPSLRNKETFMKIQEKRQKMVGHVRGDDSEDDSGLLCSIPFTPQNSRTDIRLQNHPSLPLKQNDFVSRVEQKRESLRMAIASPDMDCPKVPLASPVCDADDRWPQEDEMFLHEEHCSKCPRGLVGECLRNIKEDDAEEEDEDEEKEDLAKFDYDSVPAAPPSPSPFTPQNSLSDMSFGAFGFENQMAEFNEGQLIKQVNKKRVGLSDSDNDDVFEHHDGSVPSSPLPTIVIDEAHEKKPDDEEDGVVKAAPSASVARARPKPKFGRMDSITLAKIAIAKSAQKFKNILLQKRAREALQGMKEVDIEEERKKFAAKFVDDIIRRSIEIHLSNETKEYVNEIRARTSISEEQLPPGSPVGTPTTENVILFKLPHPGFGLRPKRSSLKRKKEKDKLSTEESPLAKEEGVKKIPLGPRVSFSDDRSVQSSVKKEPPKIILVDKGTDVADDFSYITNDFKIRRVSREHPRSICEVQPLPCEKRVSVKSQTNLTLLYLAHEMPPLIDIVPKIKEEDVSTRVKDFVDKVISNAVELRQSEIQTGVKQRSFSLDDIQTDDIQFPQSEDGSNSEEDEYQETPYIEEEEEDEEEEIEDEVPDNLRNILSAFIPSEDKRETGWSSPLSKMRSLSSIDRPDVAAAILSRGSSNEDDDNRLGSPLMKIRSKSSGDRPNMSSSPVTKSSKIVFTDGSLAELKRESDAAENSAQNSGGITCRHKRLSNSTLCTACEENLTNIAGTFVESVVDDSVDILREQVARTIVIQSMACAIQQYSNMQKDTICKESIEKIISDSMTPRSKRDSKKGLVRQKANNIPDVSTGDVCKEGLRFEEGAYNEEHDRDFKGESMHSSNSSHPPTPWPSATPGEIKFSFDDAGNVTIHRMQHHEPKSPKLHKLHSFISSIFPAGHKSKEPKTSDSSSDSDPTSPPLYSRQQSAPPSSFFNFRRSKKNSEKKGKKGNGGHDGLRRCKSSATPGSGDTPASNTMPAFEAKVKPASPPPLTLISDSSNKLEADDKHDVNKPDDKETSPHHSRFNFFTKRAKTLDPEGSEKTWSFPKSPGSERRRKKDHGQKIKDDIKAKDNEKEKHFTAVESEKKEENEPPLSPDVIPSVEYKPEGKQKKKPRTFGFLSRFSDHHKSQVDGKDHDRGLESPGTMTVSAPPTVPAKSPLSDKFHQFFTFFGTRSQRGSSSSKSDKSSVSEDSDKGRRESEETYTKRSSKDSVFCVQSPSDSRNDCDDIFESENSENELPGVSHKTGSIHKNSVTSGESLKLDLETGVSDQGKKKREYFTTAGQISIHIDSFDGEEIDIPDLDFVPETSPVREESNFSDSDGSTKGEIVC